MEVCLMYLNSKKNVLPLPTDSASTQIPLMHDKKRHAGVARTCRTNLRHTRGGRPDSGRTPPVSSFPPPPPPSSSCPLASCRWTESGPESPGCGLAPFPYGAAAGEVCRGPEETQSASLHQGCQEGVHAPWDAALQCLCSAR